MAKILKKKKKKKQQQQHQRQPPRVQTIVLVSIILILVLYNISTSTKSILDPRSYLSTSLLYSSLNNSNTNSPTENETAEVSISSYSTPYRTDNQSTIPIITTTTIDDHVVSLYGQGRNHPQLWEPALLPEGKWLLNNNNNHNHNNNKTSTGRKTTIPKILFKTLLRKSGDLPSKQELYNDVPPPSMKSIPQKGLSSPSLQSLQIAHDSWTKYNPDYVIHWFDLQKSREYLKQNFHPLFLRTFDCLQPFAMKSDFIRMAMLYKDGGFYADWKEVCLQPNTLDVLADIAIQNSNGIVLFQDQWVPSVFKITNGFFGAIPKHPIVIEMIKVMFENVQNELIGYHPHATTGPLALTVAYERAGGDGHTDNTLYPFLGHYNASDTFYLKRKYLAAATTTTTTTLTLKRNKDNNNNISTDNFEVHDDVHVNADVDVNMIPIVRHKCLGCSWQRNSYPAGNDYAALHKQKNFYCQDAGSIFYTTTTI